MSIWGKLGMGAIGFAVGGPIGAVIGAVVGHAMIDESAKGSPGFRQRLQLQQQQALFFVATFSMFAKLAKADGRICEREVETVERFMREALKLGPEQRQQAIDIFNAAKDRPEPFEDFARQFAQYFGSQPQLSQAMLEMLLQLAAADGSIDPAEERLIDEAARILGVGETQYEHMRRRYADKSSSRLDEAYHSLGLEPGASFDEVRKAHRKLVREYHPDTVVSKGLPEDFMEYAKQRFQDIQDAYERIRDAENR